MPNKLFIGNLGKVTKREVEEEFGRFGRLQDVWVSQKPSGFAFVEFLNSKDASQCVQSLDGRHILGTRLRVEFAKTESSSQSHRQARRSEQANSQASRRSRQHCPGGGALTRLMIGSSSTRLLPPPKPSSSMLAPVYDRSPSPLVLVRRGSGGVLYEDEGGCIAWDESSQSSRMPASLVLPPVQERSRSPRPRFANLCV